MAKPQTRTLQAEIEVIRTEIARLKAEREEIEAAPATRAEIAKHIGAMLDHVAGDWEHRLVPGGLIQADMTSGSFERFFLRPEAMMILFRPQIKECLLSFADAALAETPAGLPAPERATKLREMDAQLLDLERREEEIIAQAEIDGFSIPRRPDADPRAVLGIGD